MLQKEGIGTKCLRGSSKKSKFVSTLISYIFHMARFLAMLYVLTLTMVPSLSTRIRRLPKESELIGYKNAVAGQ